MVDGDRFKPTNDGDVMSPDKKPLRSAHSKRSIVAARLRPDPDDPYEVVFFKRHANEDSTEAIPGQAFLRSCPTNVQAKMFAIATQVATAPPPRFAGGGLWEAMHGDLTGLHEVRVDGKNRHHYRIFCRLDTEAIGRGPLLVVLCGADKPFKTEFTTADYRLVTELFAEYQSHNPRSLA